MGGRKRHSTQAAPDLIRKEPIHFDSCEIFYVGENHPKEWKLSHRNKSALFRPDPFGVNDYFVDYSLNKKNRWNISEDIADNIEELQDEHFNIRVSASVHKASKVKALNEEGNPQNYLPCLEYHSATRDGEVVHKQSKRGRTRLRNFTHDAQPPMRVKGKPIRPVYSEKQDRTETLLPVDEEVKHQKIHIHYTTQLHSNNEPTKTANKISKSTLSKSRKFANLIDISDIEYEDDDYFSDIIEEGFSIPTIVDNLSALVVKKEKRKRASHKEPKKRFADEVLKEASFPVTKPMQRSVQNEADFEDVELYEPNIPLVSLPNEMFTLVPISSVPNLQSAHRLPCFPPAWEIHQKDSTNVLGTGCPTCVIARQYGDELRLSIVNDCPSSHPSRLQFPASNETGPQFENFEPKFCEISFGMMHQANDDRHSHPFSLSCSHLYCAGCWLSHISESIHRQRLPATCLNSECSTTVSFPAAKGLLCSSSQEKYELSTINALIAAGKMISCPECARFIYTRSSLNVSCPCGAFLCTHCSSVAHFPFDCEKFRQYNSYMTQSGFDSIYSTHASLPVVRDLAKCPACNLLIQKSKGCNHMTCVCGKSFCYNCGGTDLHNHRVCIKQRFTVTMINIINAEHVPLLIHTQLPQALTSRINLLEDRKVLRQRLLGLPVQEKKVYERTFIRLSLLMELCRQGHANERRARKNLVKRVQSVLIEFLTTDSSQDISEKGRALKQFHDSLVV